MAGKDKKFSAVQIIYRALTPLSPEERASVLMSVRALIDVGAVATQTTHHSLASSTPPPASALTPTQSTRPLAIRELIQDKKPTTHPEFITLFAYYREKYQNLPTFSRDDLEKYYADSRENPPANYGRDFVKAIQRGWIHEDGESSYLTSKGIEAVESGFSYDSPTSAQSKSKPMAKAKKKRARKKKKNT